MLSVLSADKALRSGEEELKRLSIEHILLSYYETHLSQISRPQYNECKKILISKECGEIANAGYLARYIFAVS